MAAGARKAVACEEMGVPLRTLQRWTEEKVMHADGRTTTERPVPRNALNQAEREVILSVCNSPEYAHLPPSQIVPRPPAGAWPPWPAAVGPQQAQPSRQRL